MSEEKKAEPSKEAETKVEAIHPSEIRGGKKKGLLDTCKVSRLLFGSGGKYLIKSEKRALLIEGK